MTAGFRKAILENERIVSIIYYSLRTFVVLSGIGYLFMWILAAIFLDGDSIYHILLSFLGVYILAIPFRLTMKSFLFYLRLILVLAISFFCIYNFEWKSGEGFNFFMVYIILFAVVAPISLLIRKFIAISNKPVAIFIGAILGLIVPVVLLGLSMTQTLRESFYYVKTIGNELEKDLGFDYESPYYEIGDRSIEVFELQVRDDGLMYEAGVRNGDIVLDYSITGFYRTLNNNRGQHFGFYVVDGGNGPPLEKRNKRQIQIDIPKN